MPEYIDFPVETDPEQLAQDAFDYLQSLAAGWLPNAGNLDTWLVEAFSRIAAEVRDVASRVPVSIFRRFGPLVGVPPIDATQATVATTWTMVSNAGFTIPAGTLAGIRTAGDELVPFAVVSDSVVPPGSTSLAGVLMAAVDAGEAGSGLGVAAGPLELIDPLDFVTTITQAAVTTGGVDAEEDSVYLNRLRTELQLLAPRPILPADFAALAQSQAGIDRALALDGYNPLHNFLTVNEASAETDASAYASLLNATVTSTAAQAADGAKSVSIASVAAGDMAAVLVTGSAKPVNVGDTITALASFRTAVSGRTCRVELQWLDGANAQVGSLQNGNNVADTNAGWVQSAVTAVAPAGAVKCRINLRVFATGGAAEVHYADKMSIRRGAGTDWVAGATAETGNARMLTVAVVDENGNAPSSGALAALAATLDATREVNFIVFAIGPAYTQVDVSFTFTTLAGYDPVDVKTRAQQAVTDYLSPANWGRPPVGDQRIWLDQPVVNRLEIATVINNVQGVDKVTVLTLGIHGGSLSTSDLTLAGPAGMPQPTTITGTAA